MFSNITKSLISGLNIYARNNNNLKSNKQSNFGFLAFNFSKIKQFKIITDPKDVSKLVFDEKGKCKIFQHKSGEYQLKWIVRVISSLTIMNSILTGLQFGFPIFGTWNQFSFSIFAGLGYLAIMILNALSKRAIHRIYLNNDLQTVDVQFFNAFWKPQKINFHISQFQEPSVSYFGFIRTQLTSIGKKQIQIDRKGMDKIIKKLIQKCQRLLINIRLSFIRKTLNQFKYSKEKMILIIFNYIFLYIIIPIFIQNQIEAFISINQLQKY